MREVQSDSNGLGGITDAIATGPPKRAVESLVAAATFARFRSAGALRAFLPGTASSPDHRDRRRVTLDIGSLEMGNFWGQSSIDANVFAIREERSMVIIETPRLRLRPLTDADMNPYLAMAADSEAMRYVSPTPISRSSAVAAATYYRQLLETKGYGYWAIEVNGGAPFAGIILLQDVKFSAAFTPAIEVGWLLPRERWGNGYATEGGRAALDYAFATMKLDEVVALTAANNIPSQRVMQRLCMTHDPHDDFDHPLTLGTSLQRCVLYRSKRDTGTAQDATMPPSLARSYAPVDPSYETLRRKVKTQVTLGRRKRRPGEDKPTGAGRPSSLSSPPRVTAKTDHRKFASLIKLVARSFGNATDCSERLQRLTAVRTRAGRTERYPISRGQSLDEAMVTVT
jgi:RimJ/RimL family protein N-acetyltransferase